MPISAEGAGKLSAAVVKRLRQPFAAEHLRWKIQTRPQEAQADPAALVVVYVDARSVAAHLDDAAPGQWHTEYRAPPVTVGLPALECRLSICGVTRCDVGTVEPLGKAGSDTKDLYSDALKRAAVQFGVGAFLYRFPQVQARVEKSGTTWYITREAQAELRVLTAAVLAGQGGLPRFQALRVRGYLQGGVAEVSGAEDGPPPIGEERGRKMEELLTRALHRSEWQGEAGHDYASFILGFAVSRLADLTEEEAKTVYRAAKVLQVVGGEVGLTGSD
ncbi:Rad52/Rad22 family DNA repair protein [Deinococcus sp.]|uniref:Rad52/Rad22 family DNA repair protein n=1 Tax=Deinococcus sp. TaxID=47478 RepID=UPI003CC6C6B5